MELKNIYNLCKRLSGISSTKEKEKFLIDNRCEDFDRFLKWLLDPQIVTGIDKKKLNKAVESYDCVFPDLFFVLDYLRQFNTGKDTDIGLCQSFIKQNPAYTSFLIDVFTKKLKLGVNLKTVNKVYGKDFIHAHEVQLGSPRDKLRLKDGEWFSLSQKMNGIRCTYVDGTLWSRQGKPFPGIDEILSFFNNVYKDWVFDGELIRKNTDGVSDNENFRLTTSIVNGEDGDKSQLELVMFDALPLEEFKEGGGSMTYRDRRDVVEFICRIAAIKGVNIRPVEIVYQGTDQAEIEKQLAIADSKGWEGLMLNKDAPYECKRTTNLIKIKSFKFSDIRIIGYEEGTGKYEGMLGAVIVDYKGNKVNVGSGFTDEERISFWENRSGLIGRIVTVKYKEVSKDKKTGKESLQFPIYCGLREEGKEVSYE